MNLVQILAKIVLKKSNKVLTESSLYIVGKAAQSTLGWGFGHFEEIDKFTYSRHSKQ